MTIKKEDPSNTIPYEIVLQMTKAYRESQKSVSDKFTESVWFPYDQIAQLTQKLTKLNADGVRVYFGRYTEDIIKQINALPYGKKIPENYKDYNTVIFIATTIINGISKIDYYTGKCEDRDDPFEADNRGELCPPDCPPPIER